MRASKRKSSVGRPLLAGGARPQVRRKAGNNWTKRKESEFLTVLGETCNVTRAAQQAGVSLSYAYRRRKANAAFNAAWNEALTAAYRRLELELLARAFDGTEKVTTRRDGSEERMREYSNQLGLSLLKMHRDTVIEANADAEPEDVEEIKERLFRKLQRLKARNDAPASSDE